MTRITIKKWFANKTVCVKNGITLVWKKSQVWTGDKDIKDLDLNTDEGLEYFFDKKNWEDTEDIFGKVVRETEKAIMIEADYWDFRYCRLVNDAELRHGWKVWLPKSVICNLDEVLAKETA